MSLTASLNNALSGLGISSRRAEIIASNVANADTPGYAARRLTAAGPVTGVPTGQIQVGRQVDPALQFLRRDAQSEAAGAGIAQSFHAQIDQILGDPNTVGTLQDLLARFDAELTSAAADPTSDIRLQSAASIGQDLARELNVIGDAITRERQSTEAAISTTVERLNNDLTVVSQLNGDILRLQATGQDASALLDQRQRVVDRVAEDIPIRELPRDNGTIALVSQGGIILLDGRPAEIGFSERSYIQPDMTHPDQLSGLTVNGRDVGTGQQGDGLAGGRLGALFQIRDEASVTAMAEVDAFAADLITRFQDPTVDPTLVGGAAGLFTDGGASFDTGMAQAGLASRIDLNALVDPQDQSSVWRLRDGLGAAVPGQTHVADQLTRFSDALASAQAPVLAGLGGDPASLVDLGARLRSAVSFQRVRSDDNFARLDTQASALAELRDGGKVDVDAEMRRLIEVEQAYAANARLVQAVGQMMDRLTEI